LPLRELGLSLDLVASRTIAHALHSLFRNRRLRYDFVLFNGIASLSRFSQVGYPLFRLMQRLQVPTFIYWHETDWVFDGLQREYPRAYERVARAAAHPSPIHLTVSAACSKSIQERFPNAAPVVVNNCTVVPAPFDQPIPPAEPPMVVNLASIQERKGTDLFVETAVKVCQQHPTVEFLWLGDGREFGTWKEHIDRAGLQDRILFPGYVDAPYLLLRRASMLFLSSRDDPFPLSVLEAMCLGRTVVTFDAGGAPEALAGHGHVLAPFDTDAAADAILSCLTKPPAERMNLALRDRYFELYTPEKFAQRLDRVLRSHIGAAEK
jgi:glycosyltransferase involved in cell wall biosynthesis